MTTTEPIRETLPGAAYHSDETYAIDQERVFYRNWIYVGRAERLPKPGSWMRVEIGGESLLVVRGKDEQIRGFYNVCRHRGSRICDDEQGFARTHLRCPYHAWGYALDGTLRHHPDDRARRDRPREHLVVAGAHRRVGGLRLRQPLPRGAASAARAPRRPAGRAAAAGPVRAGRAADRPHHDHRGAGQLEDRAGELQRVPALPDHPPRAGRRGAGVPEGQHLRAAAARTAASRLADGRTAMVTDPRLRLPLLPGLPGPGRPRGLLRRRWSTPRCSSTSTAPPAWRRPSSRPDRELSAGDRVPVQPRGASTTPSSTRPRWCEFNELVTRQDNEACERVQRGVTSRAFDHGVFPAKDSWVHGFDQRYLRDVEATEPRRPRRRPARRHPCGSGEDRVELELDQLGVRCCQLARRGRPRPTARRGRPGRGPGRRAATAPRAATAATAAHRPPTTGAMARRCPRTPR